MLLCILLLGLGQMWGADTFTFPTSAPTGVDVKKVLTVNGPTGGSVLANNGVFLFTSNSSFSFNANYGIESTKLGIVFKPTVDCTLSIKAGTTSTSERIIQGSYYTASDQLYDLFANAGSQTVYDYVLGICSTDEERNWWKNNSVIKYSGSKWQADESNGKKTVSGETVKSDFRSSIFAANCTIPAGNQNKQMSFAIKNNNADYVFRKGQAYAIYAYRNSSGIGFVSMTFTPVGYKITYDCDGAETGCPTTNPATGQTALPNPLPTLTKTGYTFDKWYTNSDKTTPAVAGATLSADANLYANFSVQTYDISYKDEGNDEYSGSNIDALPKNHTYGQTTSLVDGVKDGYTFIGWYKDAACSNKIESVGGTDYTDDFTLYAKWIDASKIYYKVTYFDGENEIGDEQVEENNHPTASGINTDKEHFTFNGWKVNGEGNAKAVTDITITEPTNLVGDWTEDSKYTVSFVTGCGATEIEDVKVYENETVTEPTTTRNNWTIKEWQLNGAKYDFSSPVTESIELTAVWQRKAIGGSSEDITLIDGTSVKSVLSSEWKYSTSTANNHVKFAGGMNGESGSRFITFVIPEGKTGKVKNATIHSDKTFVIIPESQVTEATRTFDYSKPYFSLTGNGKTEKDATVNNEMPAGKYYCGSTSSGLEISKLVITLSSAPITATFKNGEEVVATIPAVANEKLGNLFVDCALPTYESHDGLTFLGWYNGENKVSEATTISASTTYTTKWQGAEHTLTWTIGDGATIKTQGTPAGQVEAGKPLTAPVVEREGYRFDGWIPEVPAVMPNEDAEYVAQWIKVCTVTYMDGETTLGTETVDENSKATEYSNYESKPLSEFKGWFNAESQEIDFNEPITADRVAYGRWDKAYATSYDMEAAVAGGADLAGVLSGMATANYEVNNASGIDNGHTHNYIYDGLKWSNANNGYVQFNVEAGKLLMVKVGYLKSNTAVTMNVNGVADGKTIASADESKEKFHAYYWYSKDAATYKLNINSKTAGGTCAFKAFTITDPYKITFVNGGEIEPMYFKGETLTLPAAIGEGEFQGWFTQAEGGELVGNAGDSYIPTADTKLFAQFSPCSTNNEIVSFTYGENTVTATEGKRDYAIELPYGTAIPETLTYIKAEEKATAGEVTKQENVFSFTVTSECDVDANYTITFTVAPKDGVSIIKVVTTGGTNKTVTGLLKGDANVNLDSNKKIGSGKYIYVTLKEGEYFQNGDVVKIDVLTKSDMNTKALEISTGIDGLSSIWKSVAEADYSIGVNTFTLTDIEANTINSIGLKRSDNQNSYINGIEVLRAMNPMLKALTVAGVDATIDEAKKTISVKLPNGTVAAAAELVPVIIANGGTPSAVLASTLAYDTPIDYIVTDKDGDQTTYVLTATEAATPAAVPSIDVQPVGHDYIDTDVIAALTVVASTTDAGTLSYQWYKDDVIIDGATAATYTPTEAGSYKVVVTNTLGEETADKESEVAVITVTHIYTFNDWDGESATFTKPGEWTLYPYDNSNRWVISDQKFKGNQTISSTDASAKANVFTDQYFLVVFEKDMESIQILDYYTGSDRIINDISTVATLGDKATSTKGSSNVSVKDNYTFNTQGRDAAKVSTSTITCKENYLFEAGVNYVFKMSGTGAIYDFIATPAPEKCEEPEVSELSDEISCDGTFEWLSTIANDAYTYQWYKGEDAIEGATSDTYQPTEAGTYYCAVVNHVEGYRDNTKSTNVATLTAPATTAITSVFYARGDIGTIKEMSVAAEGDNLTYKWQACNAEGVVTEETVLSTEQSYSVTIPESRRYYLVTVTGDCGFATAVLYAEEWHEVDPVVVTQSMTWDWTKAGSADVAFDNQTDEYLLANVSSAVTNNDNFRSDMLFGIGQYVYRTGDQFFQGTQLRFHTTVPGKVKVYFRSTGSGKTVNVAINGVEVGSHTNSWGWSNEIAVPAGEDVIIYCTGTGYTRIQQLVFDADNADEIRPDFVADELGTICLPYEVPQEYYTGATFFRLMYKVYNADHSHVIKIEFEEVEDLEAGRPYVFLATNGAPIKLFKKHEANTVENPIDDDANNGLVGTFERIEKAATNELLGNYIVNNNMFRLCGANCGLNAYRCYIVMDNVAEEGSVDVPVSVPGRKRLSLDNYDKAPSIVTGWDAVFDNSTKVQKVIKDNQMYIIRNGIRYNAIGKRMNK